VEWYEIFEQFLTVWYFLKNQTTNVTVMLIRNLKDFLTIKNSLALHLLKYGIVGDFSAISISLISFKTFA